MVDAFEVDRLLGALLLRFDQRRNVGATDSVVDDDGAILFVDEVEGVGRDVKAPGVSSAPLLIYLDLHLSLDVVSVLESTRHGMSNVSGLHEHVGAACARERPAHPPSRPQ
jgi:hypothetical protein